MERLRRFAGIDLDRLRRAQEEIRLQEVPDEREESLVFGNALEDLAASDQRIDPFGREAFEGVAAAMSVEMRCQARAHLGKRRGIEKIFDDRETVARHPGDMGI